MEVSKQTVGPGSTQPVRYIRQPEVLDRTGVSWITLLRWEKQGHFPRRRKIGLRTVAWIEAEIDDWCAAKAATVEQKEIV
ncbi:MAG: AlpA family phage regulatory protein [Sphingobium sp.]